MKISQKHLDSECILTYINVVTKHITSILKDKELDKETVCAKFAHTAEDGKTYQSEKGMCKKCTLQIERGSFID